jgi:hypothetical protein
MKCTNDYRMSRAPTQKQTPPLPAHPGANLALDSKQPLPPASSYGFGPQLHLCAVELLSIHVAPLEHHLLISTSPSLRLQINPSLFWLISQHRPSSTLQTPTSCEAPPAPLPTPAAVVVQSQNRHCPHPNCLRTAGPGKR